MAASNASTGVACTVCGKTLSRKADLPRHMRTHANNKEALMHSCPHTGCDYKSLQRSNLVTHLNTHTGERPNKCPTPGCDYTTSDPGSLTRHRKAIHGYEPKANPVVRPSNAARKTARRQRRASPYSTSSSSGSSSANSRASSTDPFYDVSDCTPSESAQTPDCSSPSTTPSPSDIKNTFPAYLTALIPEHPEPSTSTPPPAPSTQVVEDFLACDSGFDSFEEIQRIVDYLQSQCSPPSTSTPPLPETQPVYYIEAPSPAPFTVPLPTMNLPTSAPLSDEDSRLILDGFLSQFEEFNAAAAFFPPPPLPFPLYAAQPAMPMDDTLYTHSYPSDALFYEPQCQWAQPELSYAMPVDNYFSEPVDWSQFGTALYGPDAFFANEIFVC